MASCLLGTWTGRPLSSLPRYPLQGLLHWLFFFFAISATLQFAWASGPLHRLLPLPWNTFPPGIVQFTLKATALERSSMPPYLHNTIWYYIICISAYWEFCLFVHCCLLSALHNDWCNRYKLSVFVEWTDASWCFYLSVASKCATFTGAVILASLTGACKETGLALF